tara:strand:+ start:832 stop:1470 length:639 start_codon:yes stop_codon:yes gene_type:complete
MSKDKITDYSATASSNTDVGGVNLQENSMLASDVNNAFREILSHLAEMNAGTHPLADTLTLADPTDLTKKFRFDGVGISASNTRVLTIQDSDLTVAGINVAQEFTATQNFNATTLTDASTIAWDASANQVTSVTLGGNRTLGASTNQVDGGVYVISVIQDGTGGRTLSFNSNYKFAGGTAPTVTSTASARDVFVFMSNGTNMFEIGRSQNVS